MRNNRGYPPGGFDFVTFDFTAPGGGSFTIDYIVVTLFGLQTNAGVSSPLVDASNTSSSAHIGPIFLNLMPNLGDFFSYTGYRVVYDIAAWDNPVNLDTIWLRLGNGITGTVLSPVPTPATLALFGLGLAGLGWSRRKKA